MLENIFIVFNNIETSLSILPVVPEEKLFKQLLIDGWRHPVRVNGVFGAFDLFNHLSTSIQMET